MANVNIKFNGKEFLLSCEDGQEEHLEELSNYLNQKFNNLKISLGNIGENKLLLITSISVMDEYFETKKRVDEQKLEINKIREKFKELKSLIYEYRDDKEKEIKNLSNNQKKLEIDLKLFQTCVDRVASVSLDKKDGLRMNLSNNNLNLSVNNSNSGDGNESLSVKFDHELDISFNPRYLIDVASNLDGNKIEIYLKESGSPALNKDPSDFDSIYVIMPMKG